MIINPYIVTSSGGPVGGGTDTILYDAGDNPITASIINGDIPNNYYSFGSNGASSAVRAEFGTSCTSIGNYAFGGGNLTLDGPLIIGDGVANSITSIGSNAFFYCQALTGPIVIGSTVTSIGSYAFEYNVPITELYVDTPSSSWTGTTALGNGTGGSMIIHVSPTYFGIGSNYDAAWRTAQGVAGGATIVNWDNYPNPIPNGAANQAPIISSIGNQTNDESDVISLQVSATDPDGNNLSYSAVGLPAGISINPSTGLISGTISSGAATSSPYTVTVTVTDDGSPIESTDEVFTWNVSVVVTNQPPIITTIPTQTNSESDVVSLQVNATDPDGNNLSYSATGLPAGLSINPSTGLISGTISVGAEASSPYTTTVTVTDDGSPIENTNEVFTWNVSAVISGTDTVLYDVGDVVVDTINGSLSSQYVYNNYPSNNIVRIEIGTSCTSIGDYWMGSSTDLNTELTFPDSVTSIGSYAFGNCFGIPNTVLELPNSAVTVSSSAFAYLQITDVVAVNTATNLSDYSFFGSTVSTAYLAPSFSNVSSLAFNYCSNFSTVYAKDAVANGWTVGAGQSILGASNVTVFNWDNYPNPIPN